MTLPDDFNRKTLDQSGQNRYPVGPMPNDTPGDKLEWTEDNLSTVISDLYREVVTNRSLRDQLMADPFEVLNSRIELPAEYRGKVLAQDQTAKILVLNVPPSAEPTEAVAGTSPSAAAPDYLMCTADTEW